MTFTRNEGVVVSGGTLTATNVAAGRGAQIHQSLPDESQTAKETQAQLELLMQALEKHANQIPNISEVTEATQSVKEELTRERPNRLTLHSLLAGISDSVKSVSGVALAVEGLKAAVTALLA